MARFIDLKEQLLTTLKEKASQLGVSEHNIQYAVSGDAIDNVAEPPALFLYMLDNGPFGQTPLRGVTIGLVAVTSGLSSSAAQDQMQVLLERAESVVLTETKEHYTRSGIDFLSTDSNKFVAACELTTAVQPMDAI